MNTDTDKQRAEVLCLAWNTWHCGDSINVTHHRSWLGDYVVGKTNGKSYVNKTTNRAVIMVTQGGGMQLAVPLMELRVNC